MDPQIDKSIKTIRTFTGKNVDIFNPTPEMICIEDIAHALSNLCRFGGHTKEFYSVAEHSINCCLKVGQRHQLAALLHDASEAYLVDLPSPLKKQLPDYKTAENRLMEVIAKKFGFQFPFNDVIHEVDELMLIREWECLMICKEPNDLKHQNADLLFIRLFNAIKHE